MLSIGKQPFACFPTSKVLLTTPFSWEAESRFYKATVTPHGLMTKWIAAPAKATPLTWELEPSAREQQGHLLWHSPRVKLSSMLERLQRRSQFG